MKSGYLFERTGEDWGETSTVPMGNIDNNNYRGCDAKDGRQRYSSKHCSAFRIECSAKRKNCVCVMSKKKMQVCIQREERTDNEDTCRTVYIAADDRSASKSSGRSPLLSRLSS